MVFGMDVWFSSTEKGEELASSSRPGGEGEREGKERRGGRGREGLLGICLQKLSSRTQLHDGYVIKAVTQLVM